MEHIRNSKYRSHSLHNKYEQHLSPFGRKVMAILFKLKQESNSKSCKPFYPQPQPRYRNKIVLQFDDHNDVKCQTFYKNATDANTRDVDNINIQTIENAPLTSSDVFKSPKDHSTLKDPNVKLNFNMNNSSGDFEITNSSYSNTNSSSKRSNENLVNLGFNQLLDINDIFDCVDDNTAVVDKSAGKQLDTEGFNLNKTLPENVINSDHISNFKCNKKLLLPKEKREKERKNIRKVQCDKEKKIKTIHDKKSYRKQNYNTMVKKWLNDVHNKNKDVRSSEELPAVVIETCQGKVHGSKKIIQAQLANKDGIMKYSKPKDVETKKALEINNKEAKVYKRKKVRSKFIAPVKSQMPVKHIDYTVNVIEDNCLKDFENQFKSVKNEEIVIMLMLSNGQCQVSSHADASCIPEAILFNVNETFYYLKSVEPSIVNAFRQLISTNTLICYDAKKIFLYLYNDLEEDIKMSAIFDTKIAGSLISPEEPPACFSDLQAILSTTPQYSVSAECLLQRAAWHTTLVKECADKARAMMLEIGVYSLFVNIEMKILPIIADMERRGVCVDDTKLKSMEGVLMSRMKEVEAECHEAAGKPFQINSTPQVRTIIYDELKLDTKCNVKILETVSKGAKSTSEAMLRSLAAVHPLPRLILEYRHLHKACATFVKGVARHVVHGVVKPTWDQTAAATGRIASNDPNLQATPGTPFHVERKNKETECVLMFRSVYICRAGRCLLAADFKQLECRLFAEAARDRALQHALGSRDLFTVLAALWFSKSEGSVSIEERSLTKRAVYASLYGAGARTLAHVLQGTDSLLGGIDSFNKKFPSLKSFGKTVVSQCESRGGRVTTPSGRTRTFKNIFSTDFALKSQAERQAINFIIQGTAADVCKLAMLVTQERLGARARLLLQLHDELLWEMERRHLHSAAAIIKSAMESCGRQLGLALDLPVAMYCGDNWGEMEEFTPCEDDRV